ncbi:hypothetical protein D8M04_02565 [Oceanobacillus piezotolerans]|uniref:Uncharacterized protein n=1 Tax=Oceanobacillus piezotolerans TaxID=2448030 RepID=A0A498DDP4_9BACI|nr:hypothetical protein D8M04_02565 [Oceanobacillus piezotolerans]
MLFPQDKEYFGSDTSHEEKVPFFFEESTALRCNHFIIAGWCFLYELFKDEKAQVSEGNTRRLLRDEKPS